MRTPCDGGKNLPFTVKYDQVLTGVWGWTVPMPGGIYLSNKAYCLLRGMCRFVR